MEFGLRWPGEWEYFTDWDYIIAACESEPADGPIHRAKNPKDWKWYVPGFHEQVLQIELLATANWQRAGGKGKKPKPAPRPWDKEKTQRSISVDPVNTEDFEKFYATRFANPASAGFSISE
ncbi:hypothetical protein ACIP5Z_01710 [Rothia terrae]|uniref:hypothetical protein n=1 Tax=Rothia terrae TaxID=396015 RepID=UPI0038225FC2